MATRIRLQRHGRKSYAFYSIVIAAVSYTHLTLPTTPYV